MINETGEDTMTETEYYWLAVLGAAVVPAPAFMSPASKSRMEQSGVCVGSHPGEETIWSLDKPLPGNDRAPDYLFGYKTARARDASFQILLNGTLDAARKEVRRVVRDEAAILRRQD
jgi:hypothetical protein